MQRAHVKKTLEIAFATAAFALSGAVALAQTAGADRTSASSNNYGSSTYRANDTGSGDQSQVTIMAGHRVKRTQVGTTYTGIPIELVQLTRRVGYGDLDLSTRKGQHELQRRIDQTAKEACKQLDQLYPLQAADMGTANGDPECVHAAKQSAEAQVKTALASTGHRHNLRQASK